MINQTAATACWSCVTQKSDLTLFCSHCGKIQPTPAELNYFQVFGLDRKLNLDLDRLEKQFYQLSRKLHPDLYAQASEEEQQWSLANASLLNDAYRTLKDAIARTEYLLKLEGVQMAAGVASDKKVDPSRVPADLLEEVFDLNMQLEEMRMNQKIGEDDPALRGDLEKAKTQFESQLSKIDSDLEGAWVLWDGVRDIEDQREEALAKTQMVALLDRRRYVLNLVRDVNEALGV